MKAAADWRLPMRRLLTVLAALALAACAAPQSGDAPGAPAETPAVEQPFIGYDGKPLVDAEGVWDNSVQEALNADAEACAAAGGDIRPVCMRGNPMCIVTFPDAGAACTDGADCANGRCFAEGDAEMGKQASGVCAPSNDPCGCFTVIEDGVAQPTLCVD